MFTSLFRHMKSIGHGFGVEGVELGVVVEVQRLDALAAADLDECEVEVEVLETVRTLFGVFFLSHRIGYDKLRLGEVALY